MKKILIAATLATLAGVGGAFASDKCDVPKAEWQPQEKLQAKLEAEGWKIRSIDTEDGCYEAYATDKDGNKVEAYFNPKTLERVDGKKS